MLKKGQKIQFIQMNDFTGKEIKYRGEIIGHAKELRKKFPVELAEITDPVYLVKREDPYGNTFYHCVYPEEILEGVLEKT